MMCCCIETAAAVLWLRVFGRRDSDSSCCLLVAVGGLSALSFSSPRGCAWAELRAIIA